MTKINVFSKLFLHGDASSDLKTWDKIELLFILCISLLSNTAIINMSGRGVPVFFMLFPLLLIKKDHILINRYILALLMISMLFQVLGYFLNGQTNDYEGGQYVLNFLFAFGFISLISILEKYSFAVIAKNIVFILAAIFILDSIFAIINFLFHTRFTLNYLANSASFGFRMDGILFNYDYRGFARITGPWSEPAYSVLPLLTYIFCCYVIWENVTKWQKMLLISSALIYIFFAGARSFIVLFASLLFFGLLIRPFKRNLENTQYDKKYILISLLGLLSFAFIVLIGSFIDSCQFSNISFAARFGGMEYAVHEISSFPISGLGPKSVIDQLKNYDLPYCIAKNLSSQNAIHSLLLQQLYKFGLAGLPFLFFPYVAIAHFTRSEKFTTVLVFLLTLYTVCFFTGDFTFFSGYWLLLALIYLFSKEGRERGNLTQL